MEPKYQGLKQQFSLGGTLGDLVEETNELFWFALARGRMYCSPTVGAYWVVEDMDSMWYKATVEQKLPIGFPTGAEKNEVDSNGEGFFYQDTGNGRC
jgi:hypothetical protein